jgi:hypothetical protein
VWIRRTPASRCPRRGARAISPASGEGPLDSDSARIHSWHPQVHRSKLYTGDAESPAGPDRDLVGTTLQIFGVVTGLTALVYFIGAVAEWVRFDVANYPADIAVAHQSQSTLVALGLRGALAVGLLFLVPLLLFAATRWAIDRFEALREPRRHWGRIFLGLAVFLLIPALATSWRLVAVDIVIIASLAVEPTLRSDRWYHVGNLTLAAALRLAAVAALAGILWQIGDPIAVQSVLVSPSVLSSGTARDCYVNGPDKKQDLGAIGLPYFGESANYIYVDRILCYEPSKYGTCGARYKYCYTRSNNIAEIQRHGHYLTFLHASPGLSAHPRPPFKSILDAARRLVGQVGG